VRFGGDALVVESERDSIVPQQVVANYRDALSGAASLTWRVLDGADHGITDSASQLAYTRMLVHWLREMVQGARSDARATPIVASTNASAASAP
jgi:hypothetical protein